MHPFIRKYQFKDEDGLVFLVTFRGNKVKENTQFSLEPHLDR